MPFKNERVGIEYRKAYYQKHKERIKARIKAKTAENPTKARQRAKKWGEEHRERKISSTRKSYYKSKKNPVDRMFASAKSRARTDHKDFNISREDIILPPHCPLLGIEFDQRDKFGNLISDTLYTIDRIDSSKGYVKGNIQVISNIANRMKSNATAEQLLTFAKSIIRIYGE